MTAPDVVMSKMRLKPAQGLTLLKAPAEFQTLKSPHPPEALLAFAHNSKQVATIAPNVAKAVRQGLAIWIAYPKGSSGIQTDLTRDKGWQPLEGLGLTVVSVISLNQTWSALRFKPTASIPVMTRKSAAEKPKTGNKQIEMPADFAKALSQNKSCQNNFDTLSYTNRKEYCQWITSAKRPETRASRIRQSIEKLAAGKRNPSEK